MFLFRHVSFLPIFQVLGLSGNPSAFHIRFYLTVVTDDQITAYKPYTFFASTAYCQPSTTINWDCGFPCTRNPDSIPIASGGDGDLVFSYTLPANLYLLTSTFCLPTWILTFSLSSHIQVHSGFKETQGKSAGSSDLFLCLLIFWPQPRSAKDILRAVTAALSDHNANSVTLVGHSLAAALSLLDAVYLPLQLTNATFKMIGYGMPRVGNQESADYVDSALAGNLTHKDFILALPAKLLGFRHPSGEIHIEDNNNWNSCPDTLSFDGRETC
ncbi:alpha/beta-hydrolase [Guyanagaster necrorhizus]|uniref:Alpha/beta-hydrolase n=1 Tax=Guyanagaster necrorhizus TaxID=856835 RepID=A0A9P7VPS1_9AGAR|nr:alpha/beta-hydrolase [Guyanagaster necrorhizus MCA 3950]KAG7445153.1 alpha/beta-hydrolase [Guyanagaster necrorhizus MCA 3950]